MSNLNEARLAVLKTLQPGDIVVASGPHMLRTVMIVGDNLTTLEYGLCALAGEVMVADGRLLAARVGGYASLDLLSEQSELRILRSGEGAVSPLPDAQPLTGLSAEEAGRAGYFRVTSQKDPKGSK